MIKGCLAAFIAVALTCFATPGSAENSGNQPGQYAVGFTVIAARDLGRSAFAPGETGRPVTLFVWYPARGATGTAITNQTYLEALAQAQARIALQETANGLAQLTYFMRTRGGGKDVTAAAMSLAQANAMARTKAKPAPGRFPLVIYPTDLAPLGVIDMGEYLASHGYVVVSLGLFGAREPTFAATLSGTEAIADDLQFAVSEARKLPYVSDGKIGFLGIGIFASAELSFSMRTTDAGALISRDGGIPTAYEDGIIKRMPFYDLANVTVPILGMMSLHPDVDPAFWKQYRYAERRLFTFSKLKEFYFSDIGAWAGKYPAIIDGPAGDVAQGYQWASRYTLAFLDWNLKNDNSAKDFVRGEPSANGVTDEITNATELLPLPLPPSIDALKQLVAKDGIAGVARLAHDRKAASDPEPLSAERLIALTVWLDDSGSADPAQRLQLAQLRADLFPSSARAQFSLARRARAAGNATLAASAFQRALAVLDQDRDPVVTDSVRKQIRDTASAALKKPTGHR